MSDLITKQGYDKILKEFKQLLEIEKPHWVKEKRIAAELGDRSENAEYISAKEMIRNIDKRLRFLDKIIKNSTVVDTLNIPHNKVNFGSKVYLLDLETEEEKFFVIVGTHETDPNNNFISNKSPLGRLLLGKEIGDEINLHINDSFFEYEVLNIKAHYFK